MQPDRDIILKIWNWTMKDLEDLFKPFYIPLERGRHGSGPTNGYAIYLFSMMDLWGSIFRNKFNANEGRQNVSKFLNLLKEKYPDLYDFQGYRIGDLADKLRNNLSHNYGLRVISTGKIDEWLEIGVNLVGPVIFKNNSGRLQIDCMRLKDHVYKIIEDWLKTFNYI